MSSDPVSFQNQKVQNGNQLSDLNRVHSKELNDKKVEFDTQMDVTAARHQKMVKEREQAYQLELSELEDRQEADLHKLQTYNRMRIDSERQNGDKELADTRAAFEKQIADVRANGNRALNALREELREGELNIQRQNERNKARA